MHWRGVLRGCIPNRLVAFAVSVHRKTPLLSCATLPYVLYAGLIHTGAGALPGICIFLTAILPCRRSGHGTSMGEL